MNKKAVPVAALFLLIAFILSGCSASNNVDKQAKQTPKNDIASKFSDQREKALSLVLGYEIKNDLKEGGIAKGTSLANVIIAQEANSIIQKTGGWFVVKDGSRIVVGWRGIKNLKYENNPQWTVLDGSNSIYALNGTAKGYTPELGSVEIEAKDKSSELKFYMRWEELMEIDKWDESKQQTNLDKVAAEWKISQEESDRMFSVGENEKIESGKKIMDDRGGILTDKEIDDFIKEQGAIM